METQNRKSKNLAFLKNSPLIRLHKVFKSPEKANENDDSYQVYGSPLKELQITPVIDTRRPNESDSSDDSNSELADAMLFRDVPIKYLSLIRNKENTNISKISQCVVKRKLSSTEDSPLFAKRKYTIKNCSAATNMPNSPVQSHSEMEYILNVSTPNCNSEELWNDYIYKKYSGKDNILLVQKQELIPSPKAFANNAKGKNENKRPAKILKIGELSTQLSKTRVSRTKLISESSEDSDEYLYPLVEKLKRKKKAKGVETYGEFCCRRRLLKPKLDNTSTGIISLNDSTDSDALNPWKIESRKSKKKIDSKRIRHRKLLSRKLTVTLNDSDASDSEIATKHASHGKMTKLRAQTVEDHYSPREKIPSRKELMKAHNGLQEKFGLPSKTLGHSHRSRQAAKHEYIDSFRSKNVVKPERSQACATNKPTVVSVKILTGDKMIQTVQNESGESCVGKRI